MALKYTRLTNLEVTGAMIGPKAPAVSMGANHTLTEAEKGSYYLTVEATAASKVLTLGLAEKQSMTIVNVGGTNAVTVKNVAGDTGTSLAAGKVALVIGSETADASKVYILN